MQIEVSNGEIIDKITILEIKLKMIKTPAKLLNIKREYDQLVTLMNDIGINLSHKLYKELYEINKELWDIEDRLRIKELSQEFDEDFIKLARLVYYTNDKRFIIKKKINEITRSLLVEEKEYVEYKKNTEF